MDLCLVSIQNYPESVLPENPVLTSPVLILHLPLLEPREAVTSNRLPQGHLLLPNEIPEYLQLLDFLLLWNFLLTSLPMAACIAFIMPIAFFKIG